MKRYEVLLLTIPEITADESTLLEQQITKLLQEHKAQLISYERWGKYRLAYPVQKNEYGVYFLLRFEANQNHEPLLQELKNMLTVKYNHLIMRHIVTVLEPQKSLAYQRPESLEELPANSRESGQFQRDHRSDRSDRYSRSPRSSQSTASAE